MNKRKVFSIAVLVAFNLVSREVREHLGLNEGPVPLEVKYEGNLIKPQETLEKSKIIQRELIIEMDSVFRSRPGRCTRLSEFFANRARKELRQLRAMQ